MRRIVFSLLVVCSLALCAQDYTCLSRSELLGTARYMGMAGAMTAVGGDPSAVRINPAGLGLYRRTETLLTLGGLWRTSYTDTPQQRQWHFNGLFPQASVVFPFERYDGALMSVNVMLSYQRELNLRRDYNITGGAGPSLSDVITSTVSQRVLESLQMPLPEGNASAYRMEMRESGHADKYCFDMAFNIKHRLYLGVGLHVLSIQQSQDVFYSERVPEIEPDPQTGKPVTVGENQLDNSTSVIHSATEAQFTIGALWRPWQWLRLGASLHTPGFGRTNEYTSGYFVSRVDGVSQRSGAPDVANSYTDFHYPMLLSLGVATQFSHYGLLSLQYDLRHSRDLRRDQHALRLGVEVIPVKGLYLNAGYSFESLFAGAMPAVSLDETLVRQDAYFQYTPFCHYVSASIGYRGRFAIAQLAYQYRREQVDIYAHEQAAPVGMQHEQHRVVLTIGWHN